jgi:hypothetical protein
MSDERRKFERIVLPNSAPVYLVDGAGEKIGAVRMIGRGGLMADASGTFNVGEVHRVVLVDETEHIRRNLHVMVKNLPPGAVGFEFTDLPSEAAVEIGVIIGKYYSAAPAGK